MSFLTYEEQALKLQKDYKLIISNTDFAIHALSTMSYYDLINGYQDIFMVNNKFVENMTIEFLYTFYLFDNKLQSIIFRQSVFIENMFKTRLSQIIAKNYGVHQDIYLNEKNYFRNAKDNPNITFFKLKKNMERIYLRDKEKKNYIQQPTKHYLINHNYVPPWILFKNLSFGNTINLYRLLKPKDKAEITNAMILDKSISYSQKVEFLTNSLNIIRSFRNQIAHNLRFISYKSRDTLSPNTIKRLSPPFLYTKSDASNKLGKNDIYGQIISIVILLDNPFLISEFLNEILHHISSLDQKFIHEE